MLTSMSVIELKDIRKNYGKGSALVEILHGINLTIDEHEFVAITGPSGSGKSTMMNIIGLLDVADQGSYILNTQPIAQVNDSLLSDARLHKIGFIFQNFNLIPSLTVQDNVQLPMIYSKIRKAERQQKIKQLLDYLGIGDKLKSYPNELSGGQQQRVSIARALVNNPSLILADEPTGNLDTTTGNIILEILKNLNQQGTTIVMITHDMKLAQKTKRIIQIQDGSINYDSNQQAALQNNPSVVATNNQPVTSIAQNNVSTGNLTPPSIVTAPQPIIITPPVTEPVQPANDQVNDR